MSLQKLLLNISGLQGKPFVHGQERVKLIQSELTVANTDTLFAKQMNQIKNLSMPEFHHQNKNMILNAKLSFSKKNIQNIPLLKTSEAELISNEKVYKPFWTKFSKRIAKKLWFTPKTASPDSPTNCWNMSLNNSIHDSSMSIKKLSSQIPKNLRKTSWRSLQFSPHDTTEKEDMTRMARKVRFYPDQSFKVFLNQCFGTTRYIYNKALDVIKEKYPLFIQTYVGHVNDCKEHGCMFLSKKRCGGKLSKGNKFYCKEHKENKLKLSNPLVFNILRNMVMKTNKELTEDDPEHWMVKIPFDTRQLVLKDIISAYKSCKTNKKNGNIDTFDIKYKRRSTPSQYCHIEKRALKLHQMIFFSGSLKHKFRFRSKMKKWVQAYLSDKGHDNLKIIKTGKRYYILLSYKQDNISAQLKQKINDRKKTKIVFDNVSLDPGVRTFQTFYSSNGVCGKIGNNMSLRLRPIGRKIDLLTSLRYNKKLYKLSGKTRYNMKQRCLKLRTKIKNIVNDLHWKTASFLCKHFKHIIIPNFETKEMANKHYRNISSSSVRMMLSLSHYQFRMRLLEKAKAYGRTVLVCSEEYTSKTCGNCGTINEKLGSNKTFTCPDCKFTIDRDINGARNIMLKVLTCQG